MRARIAWPTVVGCLVAACGARTSLLPVEPSSDGGADAGEPEADAGLDASPEVAGSEAAAPEAGPPVEGGMCLEGPNAQYPATECSGDSTDWFASPYTPQADISVERIEVHTIASNVAILTSVQGAPGAVLCEVSIGTGTTPRWQGTAVSPPVHLLGGELYYLAFQDPGTYCSMASGPDAVEYISPSLTGPWTIDGTDAWTARLLGTCTQPP